MTANHKLAAKKVVIIVEDDEATGEVFRLAIERETPYHPIVVSKGHEALKIVEIVKPDLMILDYYLTDMTGIDLYHQLQQREGLERIPVIVMSAGLERHQEEISSLGLIGLGKPFDLEEFLALTEQAVSLHSSTIEQIPTQDFKDATF